MVEIAYEELASRELVDLRKRGDLRAGEELVRRFMEALRTDVHARKRRAKRFDLWTTDVVNSVWHIFFKQLHKGGFVYQGSLALRNWLVRVGRRVISRRPPKRPESLPTGPDPPDPEPTAERTVEQDDYVEHLLSRLKPREQRIVELILEGRTNRRSQTSWVTP